MVDQLKLDDLQSYGGLFAPSHSPQVARTEQRQSGRKQIEVDAVLTVDDVPIHVKTVDISTGGLCIRSTRQLAVGKECLMRFALAAGGVERLIATEVHVIYCFYTVQQDFKVGIEFVNLAATAADDVRQFVGS